MTPYDIMSECQRSGVDLGMDGMGGLTFRGNREAVNRLLPTIKAHKPGLLAILAGNPPATPEFSEMPTVVTAKTAISPFDSFDSSQGGHIQENEILQKLAEGMAAELGTTTAFCFAMLDDDDIQAIATGSDPGRAAAWRGHVGLAVQRNEAPRAKP